MKETTIEQIMMLTVAGLPTNTMIDDIERDGDDRKSTQAVDS